MRYSRTKVKITGEKQVQGGKILADFCTGVQYAYGIVPSNNEVLRIVPKTNVRLYVSCRHTCNLLIEEGRAASKSPHTKVCYLLSLSQQAVSADIIPN